MDCLFCHCDFFYRRIHLATIDNLGSLPGLPHHQWSTCIGLTIGSCNHSGSRSRRVSNPRTFYISIQYTATDVSTYKRKGNWEILMYARSDWSPQMDMSRRHCDVSLQCSHIRKQPDKRNTHSTSSNYLTTHPILHHLQNGLRSSRQPGRKGPASRATTHHGQHQQLFCRRLWRP